jgi:peptidylprolyl isomerase
LSSQIQNGDTVQIHYTGQFEDGEVFDSSEGSDPLQFRVGSGEVIPGFENGVRDMSVGDKNALKSRPENALRCEGARNWFKQWQKRVEPGGNP